MKRTICILLALLLTFLCSAAPCFAQDKVEITDEETLLNLLHMGGYGVLSDNMSVEYEDTILLGGNCKIDLNGHRLNIQAENYTLQGNLCFLNGDVILTGENMDTGKMTTSGALAIKNGRLFLNRIYLYLKPGAYILVADNNSSVSFSSYSSHTPFTWLNVEPEDISEDSFFEIIDSGNLPELSRDGYRFEGWKNKAGTTFTSWKNDSYQNLSPVFTPDTSTASIFGDGNIWMVLSFLFFLSTAALLAVNAKLRKKNAQ